MANFFSDLRFGARLLRKAPHHVRCRDSVARARHRRDDDDVQRRRRRVVATASVRKPRTPGADIGHVSDVTRWLADETWRRSLAGRLSRLSQRLELRRHGFGVDQLHAADRRRHTGARAGRAGLGKFFLAAGSERARRAAVSTGRRCAWTAGASSHERSVVGASIWPRGTT